MDKWFVNRKKWIPAVLIAVGLISCVVTPKNIQCYEMQFDFDINHVKVEDGRIAFSGVCEIYDRKQLNYRITLKNTNRTIMTTPYIYGNIFYASEYAPDEVYEVLVQFSGYRPISTKTYINHGIVEYVSGVPVPEVQETDLEFVIRSGKLKVYEPEFDVYVYQVDNSLYWLIGNNYDASLIYHLHTNEPEKLPENRKQYGFDNRSLPMTSDKELTNLMNCGKYRVFYDIIPEDYHVITIMVGMNKGPNIVWRQYFRPNRF